MTDPDSAGLRMEVGPCAPYYSCPQLVSNYDG